MNRFGRRILRHTTANLLLAAINPRRTPADRLHALHVLSMLRGWPITTRAHRDGHTTWTVRGPWPIRPRVTNR